MTFHEIRYVEAAEARWEAQLTVEAAESQQVLLYMRVVGRISAPAEVLSLHSQLGGALGDC